MTAPVEKKVNGHPVTGGFDPVALAEAEAIRKRAEAEAEAARIEAEGRAEAEKILAAEKAEQIRLENEKQRLANERAALRFEREQAEQRAKIAEADRKREEAERARQEAARKAEQEQQAEAVKAEAVKKSTKLWRRVAMGFYALCAAVALPVQMAAFWDPNAKYLIVAPVFIEVIALVALIGAAAAVTDGRPQWHYRLVAWAGALTAATINIVHGLEAFDPATAFGTALASVAGPGMWDLHEHGRIRKRDGKLSWRQRRAQRKAAKEEAARKAAEEKQHAAEKAAAEKAAAEAAQKLAEAREQMFPEVWKHALKLAAALGETTVTEAVWKRAHLDIEGTEPGESAEVIRARNAAAKRVESARSGTPVNTLAKTKNAQRVIQTPRTSYKPVPPRRKPGDTPRYNPAAGRAHGELLRRKQAAKKAAAKTAAQK